MYVGYMHEYAGTSRVCTWGIYASICCTRHVCTRGTRHVCMWVICMNMLVLAVCVRGVYMHQYAVLDMCVRGVLDMCVCGVYA